MKAPLLAIEVVYAAPGVERSYSLQLVPGATVDDAIQASGVLRDCAEIDLARNAVGVWGRVRSRATPLNDGDRVEIYRPLIADPKDARRRRAAATRRRRR